MKIFKILLLSILVLPGIAFAWKWYDIWWGISWSQSSWIKYCLDWRSLLEQWKWKAQPRSSSATCYRPDNSGPVIDIESNWYISWKWVQNDDVTLNIIISDKDSWLWSVEYLINWKSFIGNEKFDLIFSEEWVYNIKIIAKDKAIASSYNGSKVEPNKSVSDFLVKIDKTAPIFVIDPNNNWWEWYSNSDIKFEIKDTYKWKAIVTKIFNCKALPENAYRTSDSIENWELTWYCEKTLSNNCDNDSSFSPNSSICEYECNADYIMWEDWNCNISSKILTCDNSILPTNVYSYDSDDNYDNLLDDWSSDWKILWTNPNWVDLEWNFVSYYKIDTNNYIPEVNECNYSCWWWYHNELNSCINDSKIVCCEEPYLSYSTLWTKVDCAIDPDNIACVLSSVCSYKKELFWTWDALNSHWDYTTDTDWTLHGEEWKQQQCWYSIYENSNSSTCNWYYYLILINGKPYTCEDVQIWKYSWQENGVHDCTNKPSNSHYIWNSNKNDCPWECNEWSEKIWDSCNITSTATYCWNNWCNFKYDIYYYKGTEICDLNEDNSEIDYIYPWSYNFDTLEDCQIWETNLNTSCILNGNNKSKERIITKSCSLPEKLIFWEEDWCNKCPYWTRTWAWDETWATLECNPWSYTVDYTWTEEGNQENVWAICSVDNWTKRKWKMNLLSK